MTEITFYIRAFEAVLFAAKQKVHKDRLEKILSGSDFTVEAVISELRILFKDSYVSLIDEGEYYYFGVNLEFEKENNKEVEGPKNINIDGSSLIVLSIIAFHQPISFSQINNMLSEKVTKKVISRLESLDLIRGEYRQQETGRSILYLTTSNFLDVFGLDDIDDLPDPEEIRDTLF